MKKFNQLTKILAGVALTAAALVAGLKTHDVSALSWGDSLGGRPTFTTANPAPYPIMNSITDNALIGDERYFVRVGEFQEDGTVVGLDTVNIEPGKRYVVYIYYHNNASASLNYQNGIGFAEGVKVASSFPPVLTKGEEGEITATISMVVPNGHAADAPEKVWAGVTVTTSADKVFLSYETASAKIFNQTATNGSVLSTNLFSQDGTYIGSNQLNGWVYACEQYQGHVRYILEAKSLDGTIEKSVSTDGTNYASEVTAHEGDELYYKLTIKNKGTMPLYDAVVEDSLPANLTLVPGSVELSANESPAKDSLSDNLTTGGYNLGTIGTGNTVYVTYRAKVSENLPCNTVLTNTAKLTYDSTDISGESSTSTAKVNLEKAGCTPVTPPKEELPTEIVSTGPVEIVMAAVIVLGIAGGGIYLYRTRRAVRVVENKVSGSAAEPKVAEPKTTETKTTEPQATEAKEETKTTDTPEGQNENQN